MLEITIEDCCNKYAKKKYRGNVIIRKMNGRGCRHWPDRGYWCPDGHHFFIEYKRPGAGPNPAQEQFFKILYMLGHRVYVVDDIEVGKSIIDAEMSGLYIPHYLVSA